MKPEYKAPGIAALRSGEFKQQRHGIGDAKIKKLCCIGVIASVAGIKEIGWTNLTNECANEIGLTEEERDKLVAMNDQDGKSFAEIADYIEEHF